jgi:N-acyl amino acid synthase of PEP-CTERM/exosortase system
VLSEILLRNRDPLVPYFRFQKEPKGSRGSALLKAIFELRFEVYCIECGYLAADDYREGIETDEYDALSLHVAAFGADERIVGTVRLVQPELPVRFPFEEHCRVFDDFVFPAREQSGEISRLVVRKSYRRRPGDSLEGVSREFVEEGNAGSIQPHTSKKKRQGNSPLILLGMYREMYRYSRKNGIRYWYAAMEQGLARSLRKAGFIFMPIGPEVDYYGPVTPFMADLDELEATLRKSNKFLAAWFNGEPITLWMLFVAWVQSLIGGK